MTKFKSSNVLESLLNAVRGIKLAVCSQRNFKIELFIASVVLVSACFLNFRVTDLCILILMITLVLVFELLNSVIEFTLDAVYKNNYSKIVGMAKDMSAGMVLLVAIFSAVIGILLFGSYILEILL